MIVLATDVAGFIGFHSRQASVVVLIFLDGSGRAERPRYFTARIEREFGFKPKARIADGIRLLDAWCPEFRKT